MVILLQLLCLILHDQYQALYGALDPKQMFQKYGTGLGIKTVQGREAKNAQIVSFARNSQNKQHWFQVFRHYHISKLWLPIKGPFPLSILSVTRHSHSFHTDPQHSCYCGMSKEADT